jgi:hypothetical protein
MLKYFYKNMLIIFFKKINVGFNFLKLKMFIKFFRINVGSFF